MNPANLQNEIDDPVIKREIESWGLSVDTIRRHQENIRSFLSNQAPRYFPITDTCRVDNGGILKLPVVGKQTQNFGTVAFIPAAGASTRYVEPLSDLIKSLKDQSWTACSRAVKTLRDTKIADMPLPENLKIFIERFDINQKKAITADVVETLLREIHLPKALYPAVYTGETFLELKRHEHAAMLGLIGEVFVAPSGRSHEFSSRADRVKSKIPFRCYEQDAQLSTVRFDCRGGFARSADHKISLVPGGHGALIRLFKKVTRDFLGSRAVFIRNIDNVAGTSHDVLDATNRFLQSFYFSLEKIDMIRQALTQSDDRAAEEFARKLAEFWGANPDEVKHALKFVVSKLFHYNVDGRENLLRMINRPFVLMGQVPNTGRDVGGSCVFADVDGVRQKICIEQPHVSPTDKAVFLENTRKSTHFNPVFVAAEIPDDSTVEAMEKNPFWLVSKKSWLGNEVFYQESILYELLGSSQFTNVIFVEVPRVVFNPHKTLSVSQNKALVDWIPKPK